MRVSAKLLQQVGYYVIEVGEDYYCDMAERTYPKVHLIFNSEEDYKKMMEIEKMFKELVKIEEYNKGEDLIYCDYLKKIIKYLNECEVMEVWGDIPDAISLKFDYNIMEIEDIFPLREENISEIKKKYIEKVLDLMYYKTRYKY